MELLIYRRCNANSPKRLMSTEFQIFGPFDEGVIYPRLGEHLRRHCNTLHQTQLNQVSLRMTVERWKIPGIPNYDVLMHFLL